MEVIGEYGWNTKFSLLQMDGHVSKEQLMEAMEMAKKACLKIVEEQRKAIKAKFDIDVGSEGGDSDGQ